jgi:hypothetical protein
MYYDAFKHFTTLNVATAVGIVTVNELLKVSVSALYPVLPLFAVSIYLALRGLLRSSLLLSEEDLALGNTTFLDLHGLILGCVVLFVLAVVNFVAAALPWWTVEFQWVLLVTGLAWAGLYFYRRRRAVRRIQR